MRDYEDFAKKWNEFLINESVETIVNELTSSKSAEASGFSLYNIFQAALNSYEKDHVGLEHVMLDIFAHVPQEKIAVFFEHSKKIEWNKVRFKIFMYLAHFNPESRNTILKTAEQVPFHADDFAFISSMKNCLGEQRLTILDELLDAYRDRLPKDIYQLCIVLDFLPEDLQEKYSKQLLNTDLLKSAQDNPWDVFVFLKKLTLNNKRIVLDKLAELSPINPKPQNRLLCPEYMNDVCIKDMKNLCNFSNSPSALTSFTDKLEDFAQCLRGVDLKTREHPSYKRINKEIFPKLLNQSKIALLASCATGKIPPSEINKLSNIVKECQETIGQHQGFGKIPMIIRGLLGVLAILTVVPAIIIHVKSRNGFFDTCFSNYKPSFAQDNLAQQEKLEELDRALNFSVTPGN